jgi:hypothetical protein
MTTPDLASAVRAILDNIYHNVDYGLGDTKLDLEAALARHDSQQSGEVVRMAVLQTDDGQTWGAPDDDDGREVMEEVLGRVYGHSADRICTVTFHAPPKRETPVVSAEVVT